MARRLTPPAGLSESGRLLAAFRGDLRPSSGGLVESRYLRGVLLVDAANVIGSRPDGWWRDRAGAADRFVDSLRQAALAGRLPVPVVVVLEGQARRGVPESTVAEVRVVHAPAGGDDCLVALCTSETSETSGTTGAGPVTLVTADRELRARGQALGASVQGPRWLLERLAHRPTA